MLKCLGKVFFWFEENVTKIMPIIGNFLLSKKSRKEEVLRPLQPSSMRAMKLMGDFYDSELRTVFTI